MLPHVPGHQWTRAGIEKALMKAISNTEDLLCDLLCNDRMRTRFSAEEIRWCEQTYKPALERARSNLRRGDEYSEDWTHMEDWSALVGSWLARWAVHKQTKSLHKRDVLG